MICKVCGCPGTRWLRVRTVAERFGCSPKKIRRLILSGEMDAVRLGREWRIDHASVDRLVRAWSLEGQAESGEPIRPSRVP